MESSFHNRYTSRANLIALKYPYFTSIFIQINFWIIAYVVLFLMVFMGTNGISSNMGVELEIPLGPPLIIALFLGVSYGFIIGSIYYLIEKNFIKNISLWLFILYQTLVSLTVLSVLLYIGRTYLFYPLIEIFTSGNDYKMTNEGWKYLISMNLIYTLIMSVLISFINQMNKKFGPGILLPMILGRFRNPSEEYRVFMFLDLKDSTPIAEKLGHIEYSKLIRDFFLDINAIVKIHFGEIYQYVGDEIVLSWNYKSAFENENCLNFYFNCENQIRSKKASYLSKYGIVPEFRAGLHCGVVTLVEVGEIKRDLAYHGDAINVASRIQSLSSSLSKHFLISSHIKSELSNSSDKFHFIPLGFKQIRGKKEPLEIFCVEAG